MEEKQNWTPDGNYAQSNWNEARKTCFPPLPVTAWSVCMGTAPYK